MDEGAFSVLDAELRARCRDIDRIANRIEERRRTFDQGVATEVDSMGYQLHNLYGAFEQLFEEVARFFENRIDEARYHSDLIRRMQLEIRGIRPALLSEATALDLDELRRPSINLKTRPGILVSINRRKIGIAIGPCSLPLRYHNGAAKWHSTRPE